MLERIKLVLGIDDNSYDTLLEVYIEDCKDIFQSYTHRTYDTKYDSIIRKMVIELYNKRTTEGMASISSNGISESYLSNFSDYIIKQLNQHVKVYVGD